MIRWAQVIATHPEDRTVDLVDMDTGVRIARAMLAMGSVGSDDGDWDFPETFAPGEKQAGGLTSPTRQNVVIYMESHNRAVVIGRVRSGDGWAIKEQNRRVHRHVSGAYWTIAPDGSMELWHPSGAHLRIGTGDHQDLAGIATWGAGAGGPPAQITLATEGFVLTVKPGGETTLASKGKATLAFEGDVTFASQGNMALQAVGGLSITAGGGTTMASEGAFSIQAASIDLNGGG